MKIDLTHKAWMGICPVYFSIAEDGEPFIMPRSKPQGLFHILLSLLMIVSEFIYSCLGREGVTLSNIQELENYITFDFPEMPFE